MHYERKVTYIYNAMSHKYFWLHTFSEIVNVSQMYSFFFDHKDAAIRSIKPFVRFAWGCCCTWLKDLPGLTVLLSDKAHCSYCRPCKWCCCWGTTEMGLNCNRRWCFLDLSDDPYNDDKTELQVSLIVGLGWLMMLF